MSWGEYQGREEIDRGTRMLDRQHRRLDEGDNGKRRIECN